MSRDYKLYLRDIVEAAAFVETHTTGLSYQEFIADELRLRAVLHSLTIIGEASRHIPDEICQRAPGIPWREIAGARDIIVHGYFAVNLPIIWNIVEVEITQLREQVIELLKTLGD